MQRTSENFWRWKTIGSHSAKESFHPPKVIGRSSRRKMERSFNPLKGLCVTNAMAMDISRRSVPTIWEGRVKCLPLPLVILTAQIPPKPGFFQCFAVAPKPHLTLWKGVVSVWAINLLSVWKIHPQSVCLLWSQRTRTSLAKNKAMRVLWSQSGQTNCRWIFPHNNQLAIPIQ